MKEINYKDPFYLDGIAAQLRCVSSNIQVVSSVVKPNDEINTTSIPSPNTIEECFYMIQDAINRIADELTEVCEMQLKTATPTDESKDCR